MNDTISIKTYLATNMWDSYVAQHPKASVFHTREMLNALAATRNHKVEGLAACDSNGNVVALLTSARVATMGGMAGRFTSRSILYAEPICDDSAIGLAGLAMLVDAHDRDSKKSSLFTEIRPLFAPGAERKVLTNAGYEFLGYRNYELPIKATPDSLFAAFDKKNRSDIRRSLKRGLVIRQTPNPLEKLDDFYKLLQISYGRSNIPLADRSLFRAVFEQFSSSQISLSFAEFEGRDVFAICCLRTNGRVFYWYGGGERLRGVSANACLLSDAIERAAADGASVFDFGGAGWDGEDYGPGKFKSQFGANLVHHGRYRKVYSRMTMRVAEKAYSLLRPFLSPDKSHGESRTQPTNGKNVNPPKVEAGVAS